jgi:hypothetical protein
MLDTSPLIHAQNCAKNAPFQFSKNNIQLFNILALYKMQRMRWKRDSTQAECNRHKARALHEITFFQGETESVAEFTMRFRKAVREANQARVYAHNTALTVKDVGGMYVSGETGATY